jgi:hypothetical protein
MSVFSFVSDRVLTIGFNLGVPSLEQRRALCALPAKIYLYISASRDVYVTLHLRDAGDLSKNADWQAVKIALLSALSLPDNEPRSVRDIQDNKLAWAQDKPEWLNFYDKYWRTTEGQACLEWLVERDKKWLAVFAEVDKINNL